MMTVGTKLRKMWLQSVRTLVLLKATSSSSMASSSSRSPSFCRYSKEASCERQGDSGSGWGQGPTHILSRKALPSSKSAWRQQRSLSIAGLRGMCTRLQVAVSDARASGAGWLARQDCQP